MEKKRIIVVEDERIVARDIARQLTDLGYDVAATVYSGEEALAKAGEVAADLVLMDIMLSGGLDGIDAAERITARFGTPVVYLTAHTDDGTFARAKQTAPSGYVLKPFEKKQLQVAIELALHRQGLDECLRKSQARIYASMKGVIEAIAETVELRGPFTAGHHQRVSTAVAAIAGGLGLTDFQLEGITLAAAVYDIGTVNLPAEILQESERLDGIKRTLYQTYPSAAYETLKKVECVWPVAEIVRQHRECYDGSGFPRGIRGEEILIEARVLAVAVALEDWTTHRNYRNALPLNEALEKIAAAAGTRYDPRVVEAALCSFRENGFPVK